MDMQLYEDYVALQAAGRKPEAKRAIEAFVRSFRSQDEKEQWVAEHLEAISGHNRSRMRHEPYGRRIRHELYAGVVFPVLLDGYRKQDPWKTMWLAKTIQNLYGTKPLMAQVGYKSATDFAREAYDLDPDSREIRRCLLDCLLSEFDYREHEWPPIMLCGPEGTAEECDRVLADVALARALDDDKRETGYLWSFEKKVEIWKLRLAAGA